jgi:prophage tail gpP-like protein
MLYREIIVVYSEIHKKHVSKAELYYRLGSYRAENTFLYIYVAVHETPTSENYWRYGLRVFLCYFISL